MNFAISLLRAGMVSDCCIPAVCVCAAALCLGFALGGCALPNTANHAFPSDAISLSEEWIAPTISYDYQWLAFVTEQGRSEVVLKQLGTSVGESMSVAVGNSHISNGPLVTFRNLSWALTNNDLAFIGVRDADNMRFFTLNVIRMPAGSRGAVEYHSPGPIEGYRWSPTSESIALVVSESLVVLDMKGDARTLIESGVHPHPLTNNAVAWNPAGDTIVYPAIDTRAKGLEMWSVNAIDNGPLRLTSDGSPLRVRIPAWSPDGSAIALLWDEPLGEPGPGIQIVDTAGNVKNEIDLIGMQSYLGSPLLWSPETDRLVFLLRLGLDTDVWTADVTSGTVDRVTSMGNVQDIVGWSPDGGELLIRTWDAIESVEVID